LLSYIILPRNYAEWRIIDEGNKRGLKIVDDSEFMDEEIPLRVCRRKVARLPILHGMMLS
jgi:hypothetical protein